MVNLAVITCLFTKITVFVVFSDSSTVQKSFNLLFISSQSAWGHVCVCVGSGDCGKFNEYTYKNNNNYCFYKYIIYHGDCKKINNKALFKIN